MTPPLDRLLKGGAFEFQLGLRRGDDGFFRNRPDGGAVLEERRRWLADTPERYAACEPEGGTALAELLALARAQNPGLAADSLVTLGEAWEPDFLLLRQNEAGEFRLVAGGVCFPSHWTLREKMGQPLAAIHAPVPTLNAALRAKIDHFLATLRADAVWERWNWGLTAHAERNDHPARGLIRLNAETKIEACWFRAEHQAFRLLPKTRAILFAIRIEIVALAEVAADRTRAAHLAEALLSMPPEIAAYKGLATARATLAAQLRQAAGVTGK